MIFLIQEYTLPFNIPNEARVLTGDTDTKVVGAPKHLLWERLLFELSIEGRLPLSDKVATIRIKSKNELSITTRGNKKIDLVTEKIHLMDPRRSSARSIVKRSPHFQIAHLFWIGSVSALAAYTSLIFLRVRIILSIRFASTQVIGSPGITTRKI